MEDRENTLLDIVFTKQNYKEVELLINQYIQIKGKCKIEIRDTNCCQFRGIQYIRIYEQSGGIVIDMRRSYNQVGRLERDTVFLLQCDFSYEICPSYQWSLKEGKESIVSFINKNIHKII